METAILGGGCFWGVQQILREIPGIVRTRVGYAGGETPNPTYSRVKTGTTGHAEVVKIEFDPSVISYVEVLNLFFRLHDPTQKNRQQNDIGTQYRSVIFAQNESQRARAERKIQELNASGKWPKPVATEITDARPFTDAEDDHQDYLVKNPNGYNCHWLRD